MNCLASQKNVRRIAEAKTMRYSSFLITFGMVNEWSRLLMRMESDRILEKEIIRLWDLTAKPGVLFYSSGLAILSFFAEQEVAREGRMCSNGKRLFRSSCCQIGPLFGALKRSSGAGIHIGLTYQITAFM